MASGLAFPDRSVFALDFVRLPSFAPEVAFRLCLADAVYWKLSVKSCVFTDCIPLRRWGCRVTPMQARCEGNWPPQTSQFSGSFGNGDHFADGEVMGAQSNGRE